jgi:hypothetical protein
MLAAVYGARAEQPFDPFDAVIKSGTPDDDMVKFAAPHGSF